ncbi:mitochondrial transcription termination factor-related family protein [Tripterygium wilfordii]|uniref:Mitochondrial transcription termination factor-related family protein n=1 Tax=Tripterygium wilfordii TaxID=458696 RepID=A0A7J7CJ95_TRIWF|nr:transcription termination factor MTERF15, mitochondrial [Tripterygium wilfordii]XP_038679888.1 transcription termination factor MTERF15, mitochondrial [Tripterygium wilfordii]KAF5734114.1 mitochondrial transcription termination factor-related family protein [Tripterygium wilfordii]
MAARFLLNRAALYQYLSFANPKPQFLSSVQFSQQSHTQGRKHISLANLLQRYGFPSSVLRNLLATNHFLLSSDSHDIEKSLGILLSFRIPQKSLVSLISDCPGVLELEFLKKWKVGFSKSGNLGLPPMAIKSILEYARRFQTDPDGFQRSLGLLKGLGFTQGTVSRVLEGFPGVMMLRESEIERRIEFLLSIGIPMEGIQCILHSFPEVLGYGVENRLIPLLDEFGNLGFGKDFVRKEIVREPEILRLELGELSRCLQLLRSLKCRERIKEQIFNEGAFRAGFEVKLRVDCLCKHGLLRREAFTVLWKEPRVIMYKLEEIERKIDFLVKKMKFNVGCLIEVPEYLGVNFEKQIVPRYNVIEYLESKGALGCEIGLGSLVKLSRLRFYNLYVKPYPECEELYGRFSDVHVKSRHPAGLWKLFQPPKYPDSREDVKNMKAFVESLV